MMEELDLVFYLKLSKCGHSYRAVGYHIGQNSAGCLFKGILYQSVNGITE